MDTHITVVYQVSGEARRAVAWSKGREGEASSEEMTALLTDSGLNGLRMIITRYKLATFRSKGVQDG